jgi:plastocyanin
MKILLSLLLSGTIWMLAACGGDDTSDPGAVRPDSVVSMPGFSFVPFSIEILVGGTVLFDFPAEPHNVIFERITGAPADIQVVTNRVVGRTFSRAGSFPYDCTIHPGMSGVVVVKTED